MEGEGWVDGVEGEGWVDRVEGEGGGLRGWREREVG